jgi:hypothetical protein
MALLGHGQFRERGGRTARQLRGDGSGGGFPYVVHVNAFRTAVEGTYAVYSSFQGSYKLP